MNTHRTIHSDAPDGPAPVGRAFVLRERDGVTSRYAMFQIHGISTKGVFLAGSLFLELGEEFAVALSMSPADEADEICTRARVVALDAGATPGMYVEFPELSEHARQRIEECTTRSSPSE